MLSINCSFTGTANGVRFKSDNDRGGLVQNITNLKLSMTNVGFPIVLYSYYNEIGTPNNISPAEAAGEPVAGVVSATPIWRNITISNLTATTSGGATAGIIWGRTELAVSNVTFSKVNITASQSFDLYNARGIQWRDSQITLPAGTPTFALYNAEVAVTNSSPAANAVTLTGLAGTNALAFYNAPASMTDSNALGANPITLGGATLTVSNNLAFTNLTVLNFVLGTNTSEVVASSNLALNATVNVTNGGGFGPGAYTLLSYGRSLSGSAALGSAPAGYTYSLDTNVVGKVRLIVTAPVPPAFTSVRLVGGGLAMAGSGGPTGGVFVVYAATNVATPPGQWVPIATNQFDGSGRFAFTNAVSGPAEEFYMLRLVP